MITEMKKEPKFKKNILNHNNEVLDFFEPMANLKKIGCDKLAQMVFVYKVYGTKYSYSKIFDLLMENDMISKKVNKKRYLEIISLLKKGKYELS